MIKYSKKLILDYISGNDIYNYNIDELEDDYNFMMEVIKFTKDKKMYNLCSDRVKNNYELIKFLVINFKEDIEFIYDISTTFLESLEENDINYKELIVLMSTLIPKYDKEKFYHFSLKSLAIYVHEMLSLDIALSRDDIVKFKNRFGLGFSLVTSDYIDSKILMDFFAKQFIYEIFYKNKYSFQELIHKNTKKYEYIEKIGINTYFINYIRKYDSNLANYASVHTNVLEDLKKDLSFVKKNWNNYLDNLNRERFDLLHSLYLKYIEENKVNTMLCYYDFVGFSFKKLNLEDIYLKYELDFLDDDIFDDINFINLNITEIRCIDFIIKLVIKLFKEDVIETEDYYKENTNYKVLNLKYKNQN